MKIKLQILALTSFFPFDDNLHYFAHTSLYVMVRPALEKICVLDLTQQGATLDCNAAKGFF